MSVVMNAGDRNPFFLEAGAWFTASGACEVLVDRGPTKIRQKIGATEQQVGPFLSDAQILIIATAETTYLVHPAEAWVPASLVPGQIGDLSGITVADYTAFRASTSTAKQIEVTGYLGSAVPSGIAGTFVKDMSGSGADNGGTIIVRSDGARYRRVIGEDAINVQWFGAVGDGTTDATAPIQAAIDATSASGVNNVFLPNGAYLITATLLVPTLVSLIGQSPGVGPPPAQITGVTLFAADALSGYILENAQITDTPSSPGWLHGRLANISFRQSASAGRTASGFKLGTAADMSKLENLKFVNLDVGLYLGGATSTLQTQLALNAENISCYTCNKAIFLDRVNYSINFQNLMFDGVDLGIHALEWKLSTHISIQQMHTEVVPATAPYLIHIEDCTFGVLEVKDWDVDCTTGPTNFEVIRKTRTTATGRPSIRLVNGTAIGDLPILLNDTQDSVTFPTNNNQLRGIDLSYDFETYVGQGSSVYARFNNKNPAMTWVPVLSDAATSGNLGTATVVGRYYRNGPVVTVTFYITNLDTTGMTGGNVLYIQGLPVAASVALVRQVGGAVCSGITGTPDRVSAASSGGGVSLRLYKAAGNTDVVVSEVTSGANTIYGTISYLVD